MKAFSSALETSFGRSLSADMQIGRLISADLHRLQGVAAGISALQGINPLLEAERERRERLAELLNPSRGVIDDILLNTSGV
ncbi:MAG: hypothetical protein ACKOPS_25230 [Cyanobium sp.]